MAIPAGTPVTGLTSGLLGQVYDIAAAGANAVPAAVANPGRRYILFLFSTATGFVSPAPGSATFGMASESTDRPGSRLIHRATFPGLIDGDWYFFDPAAGSVRVYDVWDLPGKPFK